MKVKVSKPREYEEIDVEFPVYRAHHVDDYGTVVHTRILEDLTYVELWVKHRNGQEPEYEFEVGTHYQFDGSSVDYLLGRGEYSSSAGQFNKALAGLRKSVNNVVEL